MKSLEERVSTFKKVETINSGFKSLDDSTGGFRMGNTYLIGGLEKSGKSSFLMNIVHHLIKEKNKVAFFDTELNPEEFFSRMIAIWKDKVISEVENDKDLQLEWAKKFAHLEYMGTEDLTVDGIVSFQKIIDSMRVSADNGTKVFFIDNLTTFNTQPTKEQQGWQILGKYAANLATFAKEKDVLIFMVIHTRPDTVFNETPPGIRTLVENKEPEKIFEESLTIVRKPSLTSVYGGGSALSQISGAMLIWRPFQKFAGDYSSLTCLVLDSFRHSPSGEDIRLEFIGEKGKFVEVNNISPAFEEAKQLFEEPPAPRRDYE